MRFDDSLDTVLSTPNPSPAALQMMWRQAVDLRAHNAVGYGPWSAFNSVKSGDNWFYYGAPNYTPGAGIGTLNVANLNLFLGGR